MQTSAGASDRVGPRPGRGCVSGRRKRSVVLWVLAACSTGDGHHNVDDVVEDTVRMQESPPEDSASETAPPQETGGSDVSMALPNAPSPNYVELSPDLVDSLLPDVASECVHEVMQQGCERHGPFVYSDSQGNLQSVWLGFQTSEATHELTHGAVPAGIRAPVFTITPDNAMGFRLQLNTSNPDLRTINGVDAPLDLDLGAAMPMNMGAADFDGDGDLDLFVGARRMDGTFFHALLNVDGTFVPFRFPTTAVLHLFAAEFADVDRDGYLDVTFTYEMQRNELQRLRGWHGTTMIQVSSAQYFVASDTLRHETRLDWLRSTQLNRVMIDGAPYFHAPGAEAPGVPRGTTTHSSLFELPIERYQRPRARVDGLPVAYGVPGEPGGLDMRDGTPMGGGVFPIVASRDGQYVRRSVVGVSLAQEPALRPTCSTRSSDSGSTTSTSTCRSPARTSPSITTTTTARRPSTTHRFPGC